MSVSHNMGEHKFPATPLTVMQADSRRQKLAPRSHNLREAIVNDVDNSIITKVFFIRYSDETIILHDMATFRTELEVKYDISELSISL